MVRELWVASNERDRTRSTQLLFERAVTEASKNAASRVLYIADDAVRLRQALGAEKSDPQGEEAVLSRIEVKYPTNAGELRTILGSIQLAPHPFVAVLIDCFEAWLPVGSDPVDVARTL
eukprot:gene17305-7801_t